MPPQTPKELTPVRTPPTSARGKRGRPRGSRGRSRARSTTTDSDFTAADGDTGDDSLPTAGFYIGLLTDNVANNNDLGLLAAPLSPPHEGWTPENPKPKMPGPPKTNVTRYGTATDRAFVLALCYFYDESTLYALCWDKTGMSHPIDRQRNGKRLGPSTRGKIDMEIVAMWMVFHFSIYNAWDNLKQGARLALSCVRLTDEGVFYCLCTMTPQQRSARFQADFDQHG
ncbi:hypothetical protein N7527_002007 [Penicillium freii]|uniref:Uncharacterized protein n=1 Tax=Penicillium freii TaxID=48697 RepID=A0A124GQK8_PENFR|nr:hypothetical protein N7527_002007 [Penicillium freii]KUM58447.1 hypothetical protein ACN42_g8704 [Penicillium freii]